MRLNINFVEGIGLFDEAFLRKIQKRPKDLMEGGKFCFKLILGSYMCIWGGGGSPTQAISCPVCIVTAKKVLFHITHV
jgi:hypothetical protein